MSLYVARELEEGVYLLSNGSIVTDPGLNTPALRKRWYAALELDTRRLAAAINAEARVEQLQRAAVDTEAA